PRRTIPPFFRSHRAWGCIARGNGGSHRRSAALALPSRPVRWKQGSTATHPSMTERLHGPSRFAIPIHGPGTLRVPCTQTNGDSQNRCAHRVARSTPWPEAHLERGEGPLPSPSFRPRINMRSSCGSVDHALVSVPHASETLASTSYIGMGRYQ